MQFFNGDDILYASQDDGWTWSARGALPQSPTVSDAHDVYDFADSQDGWAAIANATTSIDPSGKFLFVTHDGGRSWRLLPVAVALQKKLAGCFVIQLDFIDCRKGWLLLSSQNRSLLLATNDGGQTWSEPDASRSLN